LIFDASFGREAAKGQIGFSAGVENLTDDKYLIKVNNGFNTTQYAAGTQFTLRLTAPF
jgi:outer membrane receptor protein involved in Fe transport